MIYTLQNNKLKVSVSDLGAEMTGIVGADRTEYLWQGDEKYWKSHAINLFPICGRLYGGEYIYECKTYKMNNHGFARRKIFELVNHTSEELSMRLTDDAETQAEYPFEFSMTVTYKLIENRIVCDYNVRNTGNKELIFSIGGHPGFCVPLDKELSFDDYYIDFLRETKTDRVIHSPDCFITGEKQDFPLRDGRYFDLDHGKFDNDAIFVENTSNAVKLCSNKGSHSVTLCSEQAKYIGFWHKPKTDAPFLCIEPWMGIAGFDGRIDNLTDKRDMIRLAPDKEYDFSYRIICD